MRALAHARPRGNILGNADYAADRRPDRGPSAPAAALKPGERLPSVRALAAELTVNQNTILRVYERLTAEGLLERRHGDGTFVADRVPTGQMQAQRELLRQEIVGVAQLAETLGVDAKERAAAMLDGGDSIVAGDPTSRIWSRS